MVKKRGLGRSLDALLVGSATLEESEGKHERLAKVPVGHIQSGKYQPRREMDPEALEELASSIRAQGVIQPIVLRQLQSGRYEIVAGERRWRASQLAGLTEIPAVIREISDEAALAMGLIENIQRENLNPIEEATALQRLLNEFGMTHQQVAEAVGKSRTSVTNALRLLGLVSEVKSFLERGDLEMGHARALLTLSEELQIDAAHTIIQKNLSVREAEELVRKLQSATPFPASIAKPMDPDLRRLQQILTERLNLPVALHCNAKGKGKITIRYKNLNELEELLAYLQVTEE